jgi:hypothetical protein
VSAVPVVEDLQILEDRVRQLDMRALPLPVQKFDLHPGSRTTPIIARGGIFRRAGAAMMPGGLASALQVRRWHRR